MQQSRAKYQRQLFEEPRAVLAVEFPRGRAKAVAPSAGSVATGSGEDDARGGRQ